MGRRVLLVAFHYPPVAGSSGVQRTLKFSQLLPEFGWDPIVLTVHPRAYQSVRDDQLKDVPKGMPLRRAFGLDTSRHLSLGGRYLGVTALPDRWASWLLGGMVSGLAMIRTYRPDVIWSTYPIATAHMVGMALHAATGIPWVADFRDSMTEEGYPTDSRQRRVYRWIERHTIAKAARVVFTAPGTVAMYAERYPDQPAGHLVLIPNGFDEESFRWAEARITPGHEGCRRRTLVHSGVLYPSERDPRPFFDAVRSLADRGVVSPSTLRIVLRATGHDEVHREEIRKRGIAGIVHLEPSISFVDALAEMLSSDGLLLLQASNCNHQIPAKLYEYLRAHRPILALTDPKGDTARVLYEVGIDTVVPLDDSRAIQDGLTRFLHLLDTDKAPLPAKELVARYSRRAHAAALAQLLNNVCDVV